MIKQNHVLKFENLTKFDNVVHGFSTRFFDSMRPSHLGYQDSLDKFTQTLGITSQQLVRMDQIHGNKVYAATEKDRGQTIPKTDGLLSQDINVFLGVITADCVPLLFYDPKTNLAAAVHAGWRGLFSEIIKRTVKELIAKGSDPKNIVVGIGPSIRVCCYEVSEEFVENFREKLEDVEKFITRRNGKIFFNLQKIAKEQLEDIGIPVSNIEDADYCTFEHEDIYSYRREGKDFGEMMGVIGIIK